MNENAELLDLVDAKNVPIGTILRGEMVKVGYSHPRGHVRFVVGFLRNKEGEIWVPVRGLHKSIAPGGYDFSAAEHVLSGESSVKAILRAFHEEAGMKINDKMLIHLGTLPPTKEKPVFDEVYVLDNYGGADPEFSLEEFSGGTWMTPLELQRALKESPSKVSLPLALELLLSSNGQ